VTDAPGVDETSVLAPALIDAVVARHDPTRFHTLLERLPQQAREARVIAAQWKAPEDFRTPSRVLLLGMGGSAIGADIVATLGRLAGRVPIEVVRHYEAPRVDADTLVIACSFSGNTEETIAAFEGTLATPGMRIALTTGGRLAAIARERGLPLITYAWDGPPRTALGFGAFTILGILSRLGALAVPETDVDAAIAALDDTVARYGLAATENPAKQLAILMGKRLPVIIGADFLDVAARRFAGEVSENAKQWAFSASLPEFNHNMLQAMGSPSGPPHAIIPIILDAPAVHPRNRRRAAETIRLLTELNMRAYLVDAGGDTPLEAILRAASLGSWTSYYVAMLQGVDPLPIEVLEVFKERMAQD